MELLGILHHPLKNMLIIYTYEGDIMIIVPAWFSLF